METAQRNVVKLLKLSHNYPKDGLACGAAISKVFLPVGWRVEIDQVRSMMASIPAWLFGELYGS